MRPAGSERREKAVIVYSRIPVVVLVRAFHSTLPEANTVKWGLCVINTSDEY